MSHLLVTNDYPPKLGGIQSYLYELWRRLPGDQATVMTIDHPDAEEFDRRAPHRIVRERVSMLLPTMRLVSSINALARSSGASLVVLDPALPVGLVGPQLELPYAVVLHGAEVAIPARLPGTSQLLRRVLSRARLVVAAGGYPAGEARRLVRTQLDERLVVIPPGVDTARFHPLDASERRSARLRFGLPEEACLVVSVSRLVPRKGMDVLIEAAARLAPSHRDLLVAIGGRGRDRDRLETLRTRLGAPVRLLGSIADEDLPALFGCGDVWAMLCRDRWLGLEREGFGIVFLEAAASGVATLAGRSGGSEEAVLDGQTGFVADRPGDVMVATSALARLIDDEMLRRRLGAAARARAVETFDYDLLAARLGDALARAER